jgi:predicted enzyme related to lactoylglutathione lyase
VAANPFTWVEIYVQDLERAKTFYEAVFDFKLEKLQTEIPMWVFPADAGQSGAGGQVYTAKKSIGLFGFISLLIDTEGNLIGVHSMA